MVSIQTKASRVQQLQRAQPPCHSLSCLAVVSSRSRQIPAPSQVKAIAEGPTTHHPGPHQGAPKAFLRLNVSSETSMVLPFSKDKATSLKQALVGLAETLGAKAKASRPQRWPMMEWKLNDSKGSSIAGDEVEQIEVICNPNAHTSIFDAKALITLRTRGGMKITSEARIPSLQADLESFLASVP